MFKFRQAPPLENAPPGIIGGFFLIPVSAHRFGLSSVTFQVDFGIIGGIEKEILVWELHPLRTIFGPRTGSITLL